MAVLLGVSGVGCGHGFFWLLRFPLFSAALNFTAWLISNKGTGWRTGNCTVLPFING